MYRNYTLALKLDILYEQVCSMATSVTMMIPIHIPTHCFAVNVNRADWTGTQTRFGILATFQNFTVKL